ncbi:hypothetical protein ACFXKF_10405 [Streptomyces scopuliridis]|uniref:hypothetical protein n=1 Tax=Streptomyces scopuliridis TaxID=452529 RepID=UPI00368AB978
MTTSALDALYAQVGSVPAPVVPLTQRDRRRDGQDYPTVRAAGLELDLNEVAAALFETVADDFAVPAPDTDTLHAALTKSVNSLGAAGLAEAARTFARLDAREFPEVAACRRFAYRLILSFWYEGARSRPMTAGEAGVALYLSSLQRYRQAEFRALPRRALVLSRALHEGVTSVPTEILVRLGEVMAGELGGIDRDRKREWLYKQVLPDYHRRRFCFDMFRWDNSQPAPLIVRTDDGALTLGLTPPAGPDGTWLRSSRAQW